MVESSLPAVLTGRDVVVLAGVDWEPLWQAQQEIARRLAQAGNRVVFVENMGVRSPRPRDARRILGRLRRWTRAAGGSRCREVEPNLYACSPVVLPPFGSTWRREVNRRVFLPLVHDAIRRLGVRDPVIINHLPTDVVRLLIDLLRGDGSVVVYHCVADFPEITHSAHVATSEAEVAKSSDLVFVICSELAARFRQLSDAVYVFPPGVSLADFPLGIQPVRAVPGPVVGYVGGVHGSFDVELVAAASRQRPEWTWVLVGPIQRPCPSLEGCPNVQLIGPRPHAELASFIAGFDVCVVPYVESPFTRTVVPTKIREYLAMGKPVVSTDLPAIRDLGRLPEVVTLTRSAPDAFVAAIATALASAGDRDAAARRRSVAAEGDWELLLPAMSDLIETVGPPPAQLTVPPSRFSSSSRRRRASSGVVNASCLARGVSARWLKTRWKFPS